jgi:hypothetical protein
VPRTVSGHPVLEPGAPNLATGTVPGTNRRITVARWALPVMLDFLRRWQEHPALGGGRLSLNRLGPKGRPIGPVDSYAYRQARAASSYSDHTGYAFDVLYNILRADNKRHMTAAETKAVRELLKDYDGALAWGGDYQHLIDEMHVYVAPGETAKTFAALRLRLRINSDGTRVPKPKPKPTKGRATVVHPLGAPVRREPGGDSPIVRRRPKGSRFTYTAVRYVDDVAYLRLLSGNYVRSSKTSRGA